MSSLRAMTQDDIRRLCKMIAEDFCLAMTKYHCVQASSITDIAISIWPKGVRKRYGALFDTQKNAQKIVKMAKKWGFFAEKALSR
ncbi:MAG: hypothetical protein ACI83P_001002 [Janthinobacterium sp.]|jgi:hypothetical protein